MAKIGRLTALKVARARAPGMYADGGGLYLQVTVNARDGEPAKSWIYRYMLRGRAGDGARLTLRDQLAGGTDQIGGLLQAAP
jgi:hypothetical protein